MLNTLTDNLKPFFLRLTAQVLGANVEVVLVCLITRDATRRVYHMTRASSSGDFHARRNTTRPDTFPDAIRRVYVESSFRASSRRWKDLEGTSSDLLF